MSHTVATWCEKEEGEEEGGGEDQLQANHRVVAATGDPQQDLLGPNVAMQKDVMPYIHKFNLYPPALFPSLPPVCHLSPARVDSKYFLFSVN